MPENNDAISENDNGNQESDTKIPAIDTNVLDDTITSENFKFPISALISENDDDTSENDETVPEKDTKVSGNDTIVLDDTLMSENDTSMTENDTNDLPISIHPKQTLQNCSTPKVWQYRLWSFHGRYSKLERFLVKNQLHSDEIIDFLELE